MEIANGTVILSPENQQVKNGITPAEALILYKLHRLNANGTPLGSFFIQPGEAETIEKEGKPAEEEYFNQHTGRMVVAKPAIPALTHKRTVGEEVTRLKRKYTGNITENGQAQTAFVATFGAGLNPRIPEKFSDIEELTGHIFQAADAVPAEPQGEIADRKRQLLAMKRGELCILAVDTYKLRVKVADSNDDIADAIIEAEAAIKAREEAKRKPEE
jgi:hypothetical protein